MAANIYSNVKVPGYRVGKFQFSAGLLVVETEDDKNIFNRLLSQLPDSERNNIVLLADGTIYDFPPDWILRLDLLFAEIAAQGSVAQQTARDNLGISESGGGGITLGEADLRYSQLGHTHGEFATFAAAGHSHAEFSGFAASGHTHAEFGLFAASSHTHSNAVAAGAAGFMTGADKSKLDGIAAGATVNSADAALVARANHTGTQTSGTISDFTSAVNSLIATATSGLISSGTFAAHVGAGGTAHANVVAAGASGFMTGADKTKLNGIATAATANSADATLLARANHTGTQAASTISDFNSASRAQVEAELIAGANVTITPSGTGASRQLTIAASGGGGGGAGGVHSVWPFAAAGFISIAINNGYTSTLAQNSGNQNFYPFVPMIGFTCDALKLEVTVANAGAGFYLAIYSVNADGTPNALLGYTTLQDASTTGYRTGTLNASVALAAGTPYFLAFTPTGTGATFRAVNVGSALTLDGDGSTLYYRYTGGAAPAGPVGSVTLGAGNPTRIYLRKA